MEEELRRLEESLWRAETRFDRRYMDAVLAPDFAEFGRSGRRWDRAEILAMTGDVLDARLVDLRVSLLADGVALVTYVSEVQTNGVAGDVQRANRSSVWVHGDGAWRLRFHQGTPVTARADRTSSAT
ncbi:nuclear transport factor 2 family protein [Aquipuribacter sp. SD81]|uniref:nuclear transport factor 2 family protein n=1 Tax=Aquipuribacter sp. SD81 TaxID=3127703 RepID=UPI003015ABBE